MAILTNSSTGSNTSGNNQAAVKVSVGGCITEALKNALESQLVIEFPDALSSPGNVDVLSSTAVNQIVAQLVVSDEFQDLLTTTITTDPTLTTIVDSVIASEGFSTALDTAIDTKLEDSETIDALGAALAANADFVTAMTSAVISQSDFTTAVENTVEIYLASLNISFCAEQTFTVVTGNIVEVPLQNQTDNNYWFDFHVRSYDNSIGGGTSAESGVIRDRAPSTVFINFPSALPGDTVFLYSTVQSCRI